MQCRSCPLRAHQRLYRLVRPFRALRNFWNNTYPAPSNKFHPTRKPTTTCFMSPDAKSRQPMSHTANGPGSSQPMVTHICQTLIPSTAHRHGSLLAVPELFAHPHTSQKMQTIRPQSPPQSNQKRQALLSLLSFPLPHSLAPPRVHCKKADRIVQMSISRGQSGPQEEETSVQSFWQTRLYKMQQAVPPSSGGPVPSALSLLHLLHGHVSRQIQLPSSSDHPVIVPANLCLEPSLASRQSRPSSELVPVYSLGGLTPPQSPRSGQDQRHRPRGQKQAPRRLSSLPAPAHRKSFPCRLTAPCNLTTRQTA